jgi:hypothetical protein
LTYVRRSRYQLADAPLTVVVAFASPAAGLVTVDVDQSEYGLGGGHPYGFQ